MTIFLSYKWLYMLFQVRHEILLQHTFTGNKNMCRGREEAEEREGPRAKARKKVISCELCSLEASLYCAADDAFLCRNCDRFVHAANFLAQRHIRCLLCSSCRCFTRRYIVGTSLSSLEGMIIFMALATVSSIHRSRQPRLVVYLISFSPLALSSQYHCRPCRVLSPS